LRYTLQAIIWYDWVLEALQDIMALARLCRILP